MTEVTIIAIDRAEAEICRATKKFAKNFGIMPKLILLVNKAFRDTPAYQGNETDGYFEEVCIDFNDNELLAKTVSRLCGDSMVITHCRMEEAIKDFQQIIPLLKNSLNPSVESLESCTEKSKMREALQKYPEITPHFIILDSIEDYSSKSFQDLKFPVIIKPNGLHSSFLVKRCDEIATLKDNLVRTFSAIDSVYEREYGTGNRSVIVEEFIHGDMYSVDAYVNEIGYVSILPLVRVITSADVGKDGHYGYEFMLPSTLNDESISSAQACVRKCIDAVGLRNSVAHIELFDTNNGWKIIEIGPRIGGYRQAMYKEAFGIDHYYNDLLIHAGIKTEIEPIYSRYSACINFYTEKEGIIKSIAGVDKAKNIPSIVQFGVYTKEGDKAVFASNGGKMVADATFGNSNKQALELDIATLRETLQFNVE